MDLAPLGEAAGWLAGAKVLAPFLEKIFGQAASEVGGMLADPIAEWRKDLVRRRQERLIRIGSGAAQQIKDTGTEPIMIPDYIAVPLLHRATLVDDESLQEKWASLLATAAHPQLASSISHLFPVMLASLSPRQAQFLDVVFDYSYRNISIKVRPIAASTIAAHSRMNNEKLVNAVGNSSFRWTSNEEKASALDNLATQGILKRDQAIHPDSYNALAGKIFAEGKLKTPYHCPDDHVVHMEDNYELTVTGTEFIMVCRPLNQRPWTAP